MVMAAEHDRMALKINGEDDRLLRADFLKMAATAGLAAGTANQAIDEMLAGLRAGVEAMTIPRVSGIDQDIVSKAERMLSLCRERVGSFV